MLDWQPWLEILDNIRQHRLRTLLAGFSVAWGLFILVLLLGIGETVRLSLEQDFEQEATNLIQIQPGQVSLPYKGLSVGRRVRLNNDLIGDLAEHVPHVADSNAQLRMSPQKLVRHEERVGLMPVLGVQSGYRKSQKLEVLEGRFINEFDCRWQRKVVVLGASAAKVLFRQHEKVEGSWVTVNDVPFQVVGVFEDKGSVEESRALFMPLQTGQAFSDVGPYYHQLSLNLLGFDLETSLEAQRLAVARIASALRFDPADPRALEVSNNLQRVSEFLGLFASIRSFLWLVGLGTLMAGLVGISNIMLISVRERTREIGLRKALGATPGQIQRQFLFEALLIAVTAGFVGVFAGLLGLELLEWAMGNLTVGEGLRIGHLRHDAVWGAIALLVLCSTLSGWLPARRAARIQPVEALHVN